jgi:hypothetical protein
METEVDAIRRRRRELRAEFGPLYDRVSAILFEQDPGDVNFGDNTDEYESEVDLIVPRLRSCTSVDDVQRVVVDVFSKMFDDDTVSSPARFRRVASLIWTELSSLTVGGRPTGR